MPEKTVNECFAVSFAFHLIQALAIMAFDTQTTRDTACHAANVNSPFACTLFPNEPSNKLSERSALHLAQLSLLAQPALFLNASARKNILKLLIIIRQQICHIGWPEKVVLFQNMSEGH